MKTFLSVFLIAILPSSAFGADLCQDLARDIRNRPSITSGSMRAATGIRQKPAFLTEASRDYNNDAGEEIISLPSAETYAVVFTGGADRCRGINFYRIGKPELQLPDPPIPDDHDLVEGNACADGVKIYEFAFGTIHKVPAFLFSQSDMVDFSESIWIAELSGSSWRNGCHVEARFEAMIEPPRTFVAPDSGFKKEEWSRAATEIAHTYGPVLQNPDFRFGAPVPEGSKAIAEKLLGFVKKDWLMLLPLFGTEDKDAADFATNGSGGMSFYTVVLNDHPYVLEIGHKIGIRATAYPPMGLILFDLKDGKPIPVASAYIDVKRGPLKSLTAN